MLLCSFILMLLRAFYMVSSVVVMYQMQRSVYVCVAYESYTNLRRAQNKSSRDTFCS